MATYAAVAARGSPTATSNPSPPPPATADSGTLNAASQGSAQASYTKAHPEPQSSKKPKDGSDAPPAYGSQQGTFPVHPYPDVEAYPNGGNSGGRGGQPPPNPNPNTAVQNGSTAYHLHHREPTWWRFVKALATAVLIYLLASLLVESMYLAAKWGWDHRPGHDHDHLPGNYHIPADVSLHQCATNDNWKRSSVTTMQELSSFIANPGNGSGDYPYASYTSFDLPLGSTDDSSVVFLSRGPRLGGHVSVVTSARQRQGQISATIIVKYYKSEAREEVKACIVEREDGAKGFGIFTPTHNWDWDHRDHQVSYEAMVVLPEGSPFMVKQLETDVPNSSQHLNLDGNKILFENVFLKGSNGHVEVEAPLAARKVTIQDSNSDVTGHFNVTDELVIDTTNARVEASITMYRVPELENVPSVDITTSNGVLHSDILLMDAPSTSSKSLKTTHPHYKVHTSTTNSRLDVSFTGAPTDAVLTFNGSSTNGGASARLYQTYSGAYELETSNSVADLVVLCPGPAPVPTPKDEEEVNWDYAYGGGDERPLSGGGKQCKGGVSMVNEEVSRKTYKKGLVEWVPVDHSLKEKEKDKWESSVGLKTTNGPAVLQL